MQEMAGIAMRFYTLTFSPGFEGGVGRALRRGVAAAPVEMGDTQWGAQAGNASRSLTSGEEEGDPQVFQ
ncbi:hypothetical protein GCM10023352_19120 [Rothia endophytica]|uniref:Uncharacterized protein n=1 Tax=Rothia endophytica TaxID=1324766 RepID=A0ABP9BRG5_9MICC